jgi:hypothetical protein
MDLKNDPTYRKKNNPYSWSNYIKRTIIGEALVDCKKGKPCLIKRTHKQWGGKIESAITELQILKKDVKKGSIIYWGDLISTNNICKIFAKVSKNLNMTPEQLAKFLEQKHNTEKILNS